MSILAAGLLLFTPRGFFALEQSWTEPFAIAWLGLAVWAASARRPVLAAVALGLAMATKQYLVLAAPMLWHLGATADERRTLVLAAGATVVVALLPALGDPQGFFHSAVMVQVREELRMDALSLAVPLARWTGAPLPGIAYAALVAAAALAAAWRAPSTPAGATAALAVTLLTAFAFGKKAFCNYYVLVIAVLAMAIAARRNGEVPDQRPAASARAGSGGQRRSGRCEPAAFEAQHAVALLRQPRVVRGDHRRQPELGVHVAQQAVQGVGGRLVEVAGGLVGQQERRVLHQRPGHRHPLLFAARRACRAGARAVRRARRGRAAPRPSAAPRRRRSGRCAAASRRSRGR